MRGRRTPCCIDTLDYESGVLECVYIAEKGTFGDSKLIGQFIQHVPDITGKELHYSQPPFYLGLIHYGLSWVKLNEGNKSI